MRDELKRRKKILLLTKNLPQIHSLQFYSFIGLQQNFSNPSALPNIISPPHFFFLQTIVIMDLLSYIKKREKPQKHSDPSKHENQKLPSKLNQRLDTQAYMMSKKQKVYTEYVVPLEQYQYQVKKYKVSVKHLLNTLIHLKDEIQAQLQTLLENMNNSEIWAEHHRLLSLKLFRYQQTNQQQLLQNYNSIIQGCELLYSKLHNNERVKEIFYVKDQEDFLLFFKHLFGKPYVLCNLPSFRKVLQNMWERQLFPSLQTSKILENIRLWIHGILVPSNPSSICLNKLVFQNVQAIPKFVNFLRNQSIYHHINNSDCLGLTPLLVAAHGNITTAYQTLIRYHSDTYLCPLTLTKGKKTEVVENKSDRKIINIDYPTTEKKQFNFFELMMYQKQYQQIINVLSFMEVRKLKTVKKNKLLYEKISELPDCCFQIHWKTSKGILTFKQLPKDIVTVYKKDGFLRIDYHVDSLQKPTNGHYSILLKTYPNKKMEYYLISHHGKKILNLMRQIDSQKLKMRYENITQFGNIQQQQISSIKSIYKAKNQTLEANVTFSYENISKAEVFSFTNLNEYEKTLVNSETLDYSLLDKSEMKSVLTGKIGNLPKTKSKTIKSNTSFKLDFTYEEKLNFHHILFVLDLLDKKSILFIRLTNIFKKIINENAYKMLNLQKMFPNKISFNIDDNFNFQIQTKNLVYCSLDDAVFGLQYRAKQLNYEEADNDLSSLQETVFMEECYSISVSQFLGKSQSMLELEDAEANRKFEELLTRQIDSLYEEEEK